MNYLNNCLSQQSWGCFHHLKIHKKKDKRGEGRDNFPLFKCSGLLQGFPDVPRALGLLSGVFFDETLKRNRTQREQDWRFVQ